MLLSAIDIGKALLNTLMGMGTVFVVLFFISWIISLFKYLYKPAPEVKKEAPAEIVAVQAEEEEEEELLDDSELVAVITAAIAAYEGETSTSNGGFRVRSIKRAGR